MRILILNFLLFIFANGILAQTVTIGNQIWSTKNLDVTTFRNGDPILEAKTKEEWVKAGENKQPVWCYFKFSINNNSKYGKFYNGYALKDPRGLAPEGWHIPSNDEWLSLLNSTGVKFIEKYDNSLKEFVGDENSQFRSTMGWDENLNGTNKTGLNITPGGYIDDLGIFFELHKSDAELWSSNLDIMIIPVTESRIPSAYGMSFYFNGELSLRARWLTNGLNVRCIKGNLSEVEFNKSISNNERQESSINESQFQIEKKIENIELPIIIHNSNNKKSFIGSNIINTNEKDFKNDYKRLNKDFSDYSQLIKKIESDSNSIKEYTKNGLDKKLLVQNYQFINNSSIYKPNDKAIEKILKKYDINKDDFLTANSNNILINVNLIDQEDNFLILPKQNFNIDKIKLDFKLVRKLLKEDLMYVLDSEKERFCKSLTNLDQNYFRLEKNIQENSSILKKLNTEKLIATQNLIYFGDKVNNDKSGFGVLLDNVNDTLFIGYWKDDKPDLLNGKVFCYNYEQDVLYFNYGNIIFGSSKQGLVFLGEKKNNLYQGNVTIVYNSGGYYKGYFESGLRTGKGIEQYSNGNKYEGDYKDDKFNGQGKYSFSNGDIYEGDWLNGKKNGYGVYKYIDGSIYEGDYKDDKFNGQGKYSFSNGDIYEGDWGNGQRTGWGKYTSRNGIVEEGIYENGTLIKSKETTSDNNSNIEKSPRDLWMEYEENLAQDALTKDNNLKPSNSSDIVFSRPNLKFNYIDNRELCCYCKEKYAKYTNTGEFEKFVEEVYYLTETLYLHHKKIGANDEHVKTDLKRLENFITITYVKKNPLYVGLVVLPKFHLGVTIPLSDAIGDKFGLSDDLGEKLGKTTRDLNMYKVEKFCRPECEHECSKMYKCPCN